jgi:undecaprenyl diphosphate synthase
VTSSAAQQEEPKAASSAAGPRHVAIIMDGNGRWAKRRRLPRVAGHRAGVEAVRKVVETAPTLGIEVLTLYAFSSENWKRPATEVSYLMELLKQYLLSEIAELDKNGVRLSFIGNYNELSPDIRGLLEGAVARTRENKRLRLVIALNYGGQDEIVRAVRRAAVDLADGKIDRIDEEAIASRLDTADLPPLDLLIRTSGEKRLSNFLLWQSAYAEFIFLDEYWPDFNSESLARAVETYAQRERRYGGI